MHMSFKRVRATATATLRSPYFWAVILRVVCFWWISPISFRGDAADYEHIAANLAAGNGFSRCPLPPFPPTAQRPPLFSLILAGLYFLGAGNLWAAFVLNLAFDLLSIWLVRQWAEEAGFKGAGIRCAGWVVALCPFLLAYGPYTTTENLSALLFLAASLMTFRLGRKVSKKKLLEFLPAAGAGIFWGLLSLCRSYFLLFPVLLFARPSSAKWRRKRLAVLLAFSFAAPSVWVVRNTLIFGKPAFSQGAAVGWQAYQGLCFTNFDWWDLNDVKKVYEHPLLSKMIASYCTTDDEMAALDHEVREEVVQDCVLDRPLDAAYNAAAKGVMLFINWGQVLPYTEIPAWIRWPINTFLVFYWWCVALVLFRKKRGDATALKYAVTGILYVVAVTLPFSVDARYLLGPFLLMLLTALEAAGGPGALILAGLPWLSRPSRRGSRTL
jgi:hypothetical protein